MNTENTNLGFGSEPNPSTWITINNGKLTVRATEDDEGAVIREYTNKDGERRSVWEYQYTYSDEYSIDIQHWNYI